MCFRLRSCDIDEECRKSYEHNYGLKPYGDISRLRAKNVPDHDLFCAGFPCQPFSIIGKRRGFSDVRGTLFFEIVRILKEKTPQAVVLENVKQLVTNDNGRTLATILDTLDSIGYRNPQWRLLNALDFGLPQKRERILIVGILGGIQSPFPWPNSATKPKPLSEILESKPNLRHSASERIRRRRHAVHTSKFHPAIWHENKSGNISSHPFSCALRAGASHNYLLVDGKRRLTPREMLRLQGFPDSFEIICNDSQTRKQTGNAVPVPMVAAVVRSVLNVYQSTQIARQCSPAPLAISTG